ncbi:reverse transcriptase (RNA-dependent DNA polymerase) [Marinimicrobium koreense]|uniref:RNA-directed DNA polymerase n=1 Tax=Marinimicrobium koreense TaxID=306545 RepID=A0A3N1NXY7_9GAMM|nr:retron St85 family RNA-directed DNA polymerase [Marinimicrobium koreense]ROQ19867.1 reverse transcriptase (RNA-dependent DNA polymerase) [Marinimicrobium koreense]
MMIGLDISEQISKDLYVSAFQVDRLINRAPHAYKIFFIPKKTGGQRKIAQPAREVKYIQRWLVDNIFNQLPVHEAVKSYREGLGIKDNATWHKKNKYLVKLDFKDFFTSIKEAGLFDFLLRKLSDSYSDESLRKIARASCIKYKHREDLCLSVGAPSSPAISNAILYAFDEAVNNWCFENSISYTRYADDLTFSTSVPNVSSLIEPKVRQISSDFPYVNLRFNNAKRTHLSKKYQRRVTGIVLTNQGELSVGRLRKREVKALIHKFKTGLLPMNEVHRLQGLLGFVSDVEPMFLERMRVKYSSATIDDILKSVKQDKLVNS